MRTREHSRERVDISSHIYIYMYYYDIGTVN